MIPTNVLIARVDRHLSISKVERKLNRDVSLETLLDIWLARQDNDLSDDMYDEMQK